ncbi:MAG TPA: CDP-glycerol glycerophosphotransferase family protein, partial [Microbacteriaceae bacterium]
PHANRSIKPTGTFTLSRTLLALTVGMLYIDATPGAVLWTATALLAILIAAETSCARVAKGAIPYAAHLPGLEIRNHGYFGAAWVFYTNSLALLVFAALALAGAPAWTALVLVLLTGIPTAITLLDGILRIRARRIAERRITKLLRDYRPAFAVHWDAPPGTEYQLSMWLPHLEQLGKKFFVIVRHQDTFDAICALTDAPVLLRKALVDMDAMIVPSLKAAFYTNNAVRNSHFVRFAQLTHIQLNHGDSDKAPSYNPVFRMFDKNFVAGQAAIDRFTAHGVQVRPEIFSIVGRPQVENIQVGRRNDAPSDDPTVLYAPTWAGHNADSNYTSLPVGYDLVSALLQRGCTVIYRSHPYTKMNAANLAESERIQRLLAKDAASSGRAHRWGADAERTMSMTDCFNAADALISDVSSVVPDFLYSEKPFAMATMSAPRAEFITEFPIAEAAYLIDRDLGNLEESLDSLLGADPLASKRRELKIYYLGDFPPESYADAFLAEARKFV